MESITSFKDLSTIIISSRGNATSVDWNQFGLVNVQQQKDLILFSYKKECQFKKPEEWNWFEKVSRGLVMNTQGEIVARPFDKFWNYGEVFPEGQPVEITEKVDGSLILIYPYEEGIRTSTRGSFTSDQALWAAEYIKKHLNLEGLIGKGITLLCEAIYPENQIVVDYKGKEDLVLLGVRDREGGGDWWYSAVKQLADSYGMSTPKSYDIADIDSWLERAKTLGSDYEGWVVRYDNGTRVKVKGALYLELHKWINRLTLKVVAKAMVDGTYAELEEGCPAYLLETLRSLRCTIERQYAEIYTEILVTYIKAPTRGSRKDFAIWVNSNYPQMAKYLFACHDKKELFGMILKQEYGV
jgi:RNA ligase